MADDRRLIEEYLPIQAISKEASREKSVRKGHISTLHLWWARRPLVACRAAVYGALVPASQFVPENGPDNKKQSLGRANAAKFVKRLCRYPKSSDPEGVADFERAVKEAQKHILTAHAKRLTSELKEGESKGEEPAWVEEFKFKGDKVTLEDIEAGKAPRPRVLDMFAGGGAIPLEALRLGCEAHALDLNPVAHIIELCTLVYPQKYGKPDPKAHGMTGSKNRKGETTWGGLADEVRYWGNWVLERVRREIADLYPPIPDPSFKGKRPEIVLDGGTGRWVAKNGKRNQKAKDDLFDERDARALPPGYLMPVAYLWTRTVKCKNPACGATVPLVKQTWLCKKKGRYVALKMVAAKGKKQVRFEVVRATSEGALGFDPKGFSKRGNATCLFCGTVADIDHVKDEGWNGQIGQQLMSVVCVRQGRRGKSFLAPEECGDGIPSEALMLEHIDSIRHSTGLNIPDERIAGQPDTSKKNTLGITVRPYGLRHFGDLFTVRQLASMLTFAKDVRGSKSAMDSLGVSDDRKRAIIAMLCCALDKILDCNNSLCAWEPIAQCSRHLFGRQTINMVWDFGESVPIGTSAGNWEEHLGRVLDSIRLTIDSGSPALVRRGSALSLPWGDESFDSVVTDPPYYDNVPYSDISDFFYVWLKRTLGDLFPDDFAAVQTPKKAETIADPGRHGDSKGEANRAYEEMMGKTFAEANRVLKPGGELVVVYAHKTTLGWATLVNALRRADFIVTEAWPLDTENVSRLRAMESAALASSIFLVARKREGQPGGGEYETDVRPELAEIVRERVGTLWEMGIAGADLVIACVGAGLRAFTRYARVEYANGEEVPAERFLTEVETVVLERILEELLNRHTAVLGKARVGLMEFGRGYLPVSGLDAPTRFYVLWRYTYRSAVLDAGEAIIFANGTHVELDGPGSLTYGARPLAEKKKGKYRLLDYTERGDDEKLGMPTDGEPAPLVDALHRTLWLMDRRPGQLADFLGEAHPNLEQMRLVAQALAGPALKGGELADISATGELSGLARLTANWQQVVGQAPLFDRRSQEP